MCPLLRWLVFEYCFSLIIWLSIALIELFDPPATMCPFNNIPESFPPPLFMLHFFFSPHFLQSFISPFCGIFSYILETILPSLVLLYLFFLIPLLSYFFLVFCLTFLRSLFLHSWHVSSSSIYVLPYFFSSFLILIFSKHLSHSSLWHLFLPSWNVSCSSIYALLFFSTPSSSFSSICYLTFSGHLFFLRFFLWCPSFLFSVALQFTPESFPTIT